MTESSSNVKLINNVMSNAIRKQIISVLVEKNRTRGEIEEIVGPTMLDYHLRFLQKAGLIDAKDGTIVIIESIRDFIESKLDKPTEAELDLSKVKPIEITETKKLMACIADPSKFRIYSRYNPPLGKALKLMESIFPRASYSELNGALIIQREEKLITMYTTGNITMTMASSEEEARQILENLKGIINEAIANGIKAVKHEKIKIDPLNAYKYLPQLDCQKCGDQSCKNFAIKLIAGETSLNSCTPLKDPKYAINLEHLRLING